MPIEIQNEDATLIAFGGEVKALGDGRVRARLVRYTAATEPDLTGEYFDAKTDFDRDFPTKVGLYYHHGQNKHLGTRRLGRVEVKQDDDGLFFDHELDLADNYQKKIYALIEAGKMGASSGATAHVVERTAAGKAVHIDRWPLGEASFTVTPCDPHARVVALKSLPEEDAFEESVLTAAEHATKVVETATDYAERLESRLEARIKAGRVLSAANRSEIEGVLASFDPVLARLRALLARAQGEPEPTPEQVAPPAPEPSAVSTIHADPDAEVNRLIGDAFATMLRTDQGRIQLPQGNSDA